MILFANDDKRMVYHQSKKVDGCDDLLQVPPDREAAGELEQRHLQVFSMFVLFYVSDSLLKISPKGLR